MEKDKEVDTMTDRWSITEQNNIPSTLNQEKVWNKMEKDKKRVKLHEGRPHQTWLHSRALEQSSENSQCFDFLRGKENNEIHDKARVALDQQCPKIICGPIKQLVS